MRLFILRTEEIEFHVILATTLEVAKEILVNHLDHLWGEEERNRLMATLEVLVDAPLNTEVKVNEDTQQIEVVPSETIMAVNDVFTEEQIVSMREQLKLFLSLNPVVSTYVQTIYTDNEE